MSVKEGRICGVPAATVPGQLHRRAWFRGNVPAGHGGALWEAIVEAGNPHGITPYGQTRCMSCAPRKATSLSDKRRTALPLRMTWTGLDNWEGKKDFVGKRALARPALAAPHRKQLVGLLTENHEIVLEEGAQIVADPEPRVPTNPIGHVTSSYWSAILGRSIALAMIRGGRHRRETNYSCRCPGGTFAVRVMEPPFYDPEGERLHA